MSENGQRRKWGAAEKLRIVLAGMQPGVEVSDLCRREGLNPVQFYAWKKQLLGGAEGLFDGASTSVNRNDEELQSKLYEEIGRLQAELTWLKKKLARFG